MMIIDDAILEMERKGDLDLIDDLKWSELEVEQFAHDTPMFRDRASNKRLVLPYQLSEFLLKYGRVGAEMNNAFFAEFSGGVRAINELVGVGHSSSRMKTNSGSFISLLYGANNDKLMPGRVPNGYIFMGTAEGGHAHLLMDGTNPDNNAVYIWGLAYDPWGEGDNTLGIGKCADTLAEFLYNLQPRENL